MGEPGTHGQDLGSLDWRTVAVLLVGSACLGLQRAADSGQINVPLPWRATYPLQGSLLGYLLIPMAVLALLGEKPLGYFRPGRLREGIPVIALFSVILLGSSVWLASLSSFRAHYGAWPHPTAGRAIAAFISIACLEFFFRGFLLFPVFRTLGWYALPIGAMPYCLIHVGKPLLELYGSVVFGIGLAYLALRTESVVYGIILHSLLAMAVPLSIALAK